MGFLVFIRSADAYVFCDLIHITSHCEGIRTELCEVRIPVAVRRTAALTSRSEGRESAASEGREAKPSVPERKAGEGIRTLDIRHGRPTLYH